MVEPAGEAVSAALSLIVIEPLASNVRASPERTSIVYGDMRLGFRVSLVTGSFVPMFEPFEVGCRLAPRQVWLQARGSLSYSRHLRVRHVRRAS